MEEKDYKEGQKVEIYLSNCYLRDAIVCIVDGVKYLKWEHKAYELNWYLKNKSYEIRVKI